MTVPDFVGEVEGYRVFKTHPNNRLASTGVQWLWTPGDQEAFCLNESVNVRRVHRNLVNPETGEKQLHLVELCTHGLIPSPECNCGIWMLKNPQEIISRFRLDRRDTSYHAYYTWGDSVGGLVVAQVQGWGRCIEGNDGSDVVGWRCEFARIKALVTGEPPVQGIVGKDDLEKFAKEYDVPVVIEDDFTDHRPRAQFHEGTSIDHASFDTYAQQLLSLKRETKALQQEALRQNKKKKKSPWGWY